jgi:hypothetical protein
MSEFKASDYILQCRRAIADYQAHKFECTFDNATGPRDEVEARQAIRLEDARCNLLTAEHELRTNVLCTCIVVTAAPPSCSRCRALAEALWARRGQND